jgi:hypothetical protein
MLNVGLAKYIGYGLLALALVAAIVLGVKQCKQIGADQDNQLVNAGVTEERAQSQGEVINAVQNANDAVSRPSEQQLNVVCNKYDRNCANGPRSLPHR